MNADEYARVLGAVKDFIAEELPNWQREARESEREVLRETLREVIAMARLEPLGGTFITMAKSFIQLLDARSLQDYRGK